MAFAIMFAAMAQAQILVTFRVDMNGETVSSNGVHVAGDWQWEAGFDSNWDPGSSIMTDDDGDGIYELTVDLVPDQYQYKFVNGNAWGDDESPPSEVSIGGNRFFAISSYHVADGYPLPAVVFDQAAPEGKVGIKLMIDMTNETVSNDSVHVAGDLIDPNWTPEYGTTTSIGNHRYAYVAYVDPNATYQYKFINGDSWIIPDVPETVPDACGADGNRTVEVGTDEVVTTAYCFGACEPCQEPNVTITVDLSGVEVDNGGYIAGEFNGWSSAPMTDNGDGTYSIEMMLSAGTYPFKFQNGSGGWENVPADCAVDGNRQIVVEEGEPTSFSACFNQCTEICVPNPDPANITFRVDMSDETVSGTGVFVMGGFTSPVWQDGALGMTDDDGDGIYEVTALVSGPAYFQYKFVNGDINTVTNEEFNGNEEQLECNVPSGLTGGWNRELTRTGEDEVLDAVAFGTCGPVGLTEAFVGMVSLYPNPADGHFTVTVENPNRDRLFWSIIDITGKTVRNETPLQKTSETVVSTAGLTSGLYFLNITNQSNERAVFKLMVK